jgi:NAD(P)-dependent dehydrogenase (short-subunit alcohol dehydrogenase family)
MNTRLWKAAAASAAGITALTWLARRRDLYDFRDKRVVITGGSRGLGLELARLFVAAGARVAICSRTEQQVRRAVDELSRRGEAAGRVCDITDREQLLDFLHQVRLRWGGIDMLVNNAGMIQVGPFDSMTPEDFRRELAIHFASLRSSDSRRDCEPSRRSTVFA